jgi:hypothetical protein
MYSYLKNLITNFKQLRSIRPSEEFLILTCGKNRTYGYLELGLRSSIKMKILWVFFIIMSFISNSNAQSTGHRVNPGPRPAAFSGIPPRLITKVDIATDLSSFIDLKSIYSTLKKEKASGMYGILFQIDERGNIVNVKYSTNSWSKTIDRFITKKFINYKWEPAHRKSATGDKFKVDAVLFVHFDTDNGHLNVRLNVMNNGSGFKKIYDKSLSML